MEAEFWVFLLQQLFVDFDAFVGAAKAKVGIRQIHGINDSYFSMKLVLADFGNLRLDLFQLL